jgi:V/A-type H+-transporting ATPase subunit C
MENRLLEDSVLQRLVDSEDLDSTMKVLGETPYSSWLMDLKSNSEFDKAIEAELDYVYSELSKFVPDQQLVELFRLPYDFHNVKVLLKSQILLKQGGERRFELLTNLGSIDTDDLILAIESEDYRFLPYGLHAELPRAILSWEQSHDLLEIEKSIDNLLFSQLRKISEKTGVHAVKDWLKGKIDAENIRNIFRLKRMDLDVSEISSFLHDGGWVSKERLVGMVGEPVESWSKVLSFADVGNVIYKVQDITDMSTLVVQAEKILDEYTGTLLSKAKYDAFSPESVLYFLWQKEMETKNLRIILVSVSNNTDKDSVRGLLRNV